MPLQDYKQNFTPTLDVTGYKHLNITTSADNKVKASGGVLGGVMINSTLVSALTVYDSATAAAPTIAILPIGTAAGTFFQYRTRFDTALTVRTLAAADNVTVMYL